MLNRLIIEAIKALGANDWKKSILSSLFGRSKTNAINSVKSFRGNNRAFKFFERAIKLMSDTNREKLEGELSLGAKNIPEATPSDIKTTDGRKNNKPPKNPNQFNDKLFVFTNRKRLLSSSFLLYGIMQINKEKEDSGTLILGFPNKEYNFPDFPLSIWILMVQQKGTHGSGAGSVLWNTIWYSKRTKSLLTGGVAGSPEKLKKAVAIVKSKVNYRKKILYNYRASDKAKNIQNRRVNNYYNKTVKYRK